MVPEARRLADAPNIHGSKIAGLVIAAVIALTLWPLCICEFTSWDDSYTVSQNPTLNPPAADSFKTWWTRPVLDMWDPLTYLVNGALAEVATVTPDPVTGVRLNPYVFHTANVLLHVGSALLVFLILRQLGFSVPSSCAAALVFGIHPVQVEAVGWVSGLKDVLYGFLSLAALQQYLLPARSRFWTATALFVMATLSKPTAIVVPVIVLIIVRFRDGRAARRAWLQMSLWALLSLPCIVITKLVQPAARVAPIALWKRLLVALDALAFYLWKLLWPASLGVDYGRSPSSAISHGWIYWTWIVPAGIAVVLCIARPRPRGLIAGAAIFVAGLSPVLGLVPFDFQGISTVTDHYLYLPMLGVALSIAWSLDEAQRLIAAKGGAPQVNGKYSVRLALPVTVILLFLAVRSWFQTWIWHDTRTLFAHALEVNPASDVADNSLASMYLASGDLEAAHRYAMQAVKAAPEKPEGRLTLTAIIAAEGHLELAAKLYRAILEDNPREAMAASELSSVLAQQGHFDEAISFARRAIAIDPNIVDGHTNLGAELGNERKFPEAVEELQRALQLSPRSFLAHLNLASVYAAMGEREKSAEQYQAALDLNPQSEAARRGLEGVRN